jgi:hypothetical protein
LDESLFADHHSRRVTNLTCVCVLPLRPPVGATWLARAYFRTAVDVKMSQDNSLSDLLTNFMLQAGQSIFDAGLSWEDFREILLKEAMPEVEAWDRSTPRGYDRRWASMHSVNTVTEAPMNYLPESDLAKLLEEEYARYR